VPVLLKPGSAKIDSLLSGTESLQNEAVWYILLRPEILKLTAWLRFIFAEGGGPANWKRGIERHEFNVTRGSR
jgi:hypothetical protein